MKKNLLFSFALASAFVVNVNNVSAAEAVTLYERTSTQWTDADITEWAPTAGTQEISEGLKFTSPNNGGFTATKTNAVKENSLVTYELEWNSGASTGRSGNKNYIKIGDFEIRAMGQDQKGYVVSGATETLITSVTNDVRGAVNWTIKIVVNQATKSLTYSVLTPSMTEAATGTTGVEDFDGSITVGFSRGGRTGTSWSQINSIKITEEEQSVATAAYTLKVVDELGNNIKEPASALGVVGSDYAVSASDKADILVTDDEGNLTAKYIYVSDDATDNAIKSDGSSVVTLTFRAAENWAYTVKSNIEGFEVNGSAFEGESVSIPFPRYILSDGTLYQKTANSSVYKETYSPTENNAVKEYAWSATEINNVVFLTEGEDIAGATASNKGNIDIRSSKAFGGYTTEDTKIVTLQPGSYKIIVQCCMPTSAGGTFNFLAGENNILTVQGAGSNFVAGDEEFVITEATDIIVQAGGGADAVIDYLYIQKTDVSKVIGTTGYSSFVPTSAVAIPDGVTAYKAALSDDGKKVVLTALEGTVIPANTAVIISGTAGSTAVFAATSETATDDFSDNALVSTTGMGTVPTDGKYYGMKASEFKFVPVKAGITISDGKALIKAKSDEAKLDIVFDGSVVNAIDAIATEAVAEGETYNLAGQKVGAGYKGIVIKNGKKSIQK